MKWLEDEDFLNRILKGGGGDALIFPKVPQSSRPESLGFQVPQLPCPLEHPGTLKNPIIMTFHLTDGFMTGSLFHGL